MKPTPLAILAHLLLAHLLARWRKERTPVSASEKVSSGVDNSS
jgi:hypothetical protein